MTTLANITQSPLVRALHRSGLLAEDLDYHVVRASMVIMFFFFGYQKWFPYEFERLVPFISNGPLIWWLLVRMHPFIRRRLARLGQLEPILTYGHGLPRFALRLSRGL